MVKKQKQRGESNLICIKCNKELPEEEFPVTKQRGKDYRHKKCKSCTAAYKHEHYLKNMTKYKERAKAIRESDPEEYNRKQKERRDANKEYYREKSRKYATSERGRELNRLRSQKYRATAEGAKKDKARTYVYFALKSGELERPDRCETCNEFCKPEAHHDNYDRPLEVIWLCKDCHEDLHHSNEGHAS